jgi:hypothetical protein
VEVAGVVLAVLEGLEAVEDEGFYGGPGGPVELVVEQAVAAQAQDVAGDGGGGDVEVAGDLSEGRAAEGAVEEGEEEVGALEPVGGVKGL